MPFCFSFPFLNNAHSALHLLSERCSSFNKELLKVNRAEIPYSCISSKTSCGSAVSTFHTTATPEAVPRCSINGTNFTPVIKIFSMFHETGVKTSDKVHRIQTNPEDDNRLFFFLIVSYLIFTFFYIFYFTHFS